MASDRTLSDDECSSDNKYDSKVADSDYANSNSEQEESSGSEKYITKKDLVSTLKDLFSGSLKRKRGRTDKLVKTQKQKRSKLEHDQDKSGSSDQVSGMVFRVSDSCSLKHSEIMSVILSYCARNAEIL